MYAYCFFLMERLFFIILLISFSGCSNEWVSKLNQQDQFQEQSINQEKKATIKVAARPQYQKSRVHKIFFGSKYRDLWSTPVTVEPIDIKAEEWSIIKKGGGRQSINLRLKDKNDHQYVLRSIDKDPTKPLPGIIKNSFIGTLLKDQVSSGHPYGPVTLPIMSEALNIYHTNPRLRLISDDLSLGEYYDDFAGMMVMMEHRPDEDQSKFDHLGNSSNVIGSQNMLDDLLKENDSRVDKHHYLKTRLFDMIVGDWSRHEDNWRWATYEQEKGTYYKAIPRDRDHVYYFMDGFFPRIVRVVGKQHFRSLKKNLDNLVKLNTSGRKLDMLLLSSLSFREWKSQADSVVIQLTDEVIDEAMKELPEEAYETNAEWLAERLKNRRDQLPEKIEKYYLHLAKKPDLYGTDKHEQFIITAIEDQVKVEIYKIKKDGEVRKLLFERMFYPSETKRITIYGLAGNDNYIFRGKGKSPIKIKIYGGAGEDSYRQESKKKLFRAIITDTEEGSDFKVGKGISVRTQDNPLAQHFDANGVLLNYYIWD
jgi:hypothetical protein